MDFLLVGLLLLLVYVVVFRLLSRPSLFNVVAALVLLALVAFRGYRVLFSPPPLLRLTRAELAKFTGADGQSPIYLAVKGRIYDVTRSSGRDHYGPGRGYSGFAGRDASRSFVDLCFKPECLKVAHDWKDEKWLSVKSNRDALEQWSKFYEEEKDPSGKPKYPFVGFVVDEEAK